LYHINETVVNPYLKYIHIKQRAHNIGILGIDVLILQLYQLKGTILSSRINLTLILTEIDGD